MRALVLVAMLLSGEPAIAQPVGTTQPTVVTNAPLDPSFASRPIGAPRNLGDDPTTNPSAAINTNSARSIGFDLGRMAFALVIVLAMIFGARWLVTHFFAGARAPATSRAVKVLGRTSLAPRQQVLLLQVGRRVIVVGESAGQLSSLAQIDDPDEVASLRGMLQEEQIHRAASFGGLFGRAQRKMDEDDPHTAPVEMHEVDANPSAEPTPGDDAKSELSGLLEKVRSIRNQLGR